MDIADFIKLVEIKDLSISLQQHITLCNSEKLVLLVM